MTETLALLVKRRKVSLNDLAEFREGVEGNVAALAAKRAGRTDIMMLKGILNETRQLLAGGIANWEAFIQADEKFHKALAKIADNPVYRFVLEVVQDNISSYYESFPLRSMEMMTENFEDLNELVAQIERGRAQGAKALFQRHIRKFNRYMKIEGRNGAPQTADAN
jgi:DNA-binding FadR family transcriptional regulator